MELTGYTWLDGIVVVYLLIYYIFFIIGAVYTAIEEIIRSLTIKK